MNTPSCPTPTSASPLPSLPARLDRLRERAIRRGDGTGGTPCARALAMMRAERQHPGCSWVEHRAYTLKCLAEEAPLIITEDELLVGEHLFSRETEALDFGRWDDAARRQLETAALAPAEKDALCRFMDEHARRRAAPCARTGEPPAEFRNHCTKGVYWAGGWSENHSVRDFARVIRRGWGGLRREVERYLADLPPDHPEAVRREAFYRAELAVADAGLVLGRRYAECARRQAETASPERRQALLAIADRCDRCVEAGAATFLEAVQLLWFAHLLACAEDGINANSLGRMDQYLYPYYRADRATNRLSRAQALEAMIELACKLYQQYDVQQVCLGGQTPQGKDACNELTHIILEATEQVGFIRCLSVRLHEHSPEPLLQRCARMVAKGGGIPFFFSDEEIIPALTARGISLPDARDYAPIGCVEITIPGRASPHAVSGRVNLAKCLELALFNGWDPVSRRQLGPKTGRFDRFASFTDFVAAYKTQVEYFSRWMAYGCNQGELRQQERGPLPCLSLLTADCLARGRDITDGGARYQYHSIMAFGIPNVADGLMALKRLVFDTRQIDRSTLLAALQADFKGYESLRQQLLHRAPKYGNDHREVDELAVQVTRHFIDLLDTFRSPLGARYFVHLFTFQWNLDAGRYTGATPDGRKAGEPLAYSVSPQQGRDRSGLTAMMNSLSRLPHDMAAGSSSAIIEIDPSVVKGTDGAGVLAQVIRSGLATGIGQMQFNVTDVETLRKAQQDPERFANLQVRVAGFSFEFVKLDEALQEHIIARTKHTG